MCLLPVSSIPNQEDHGFYPWVNWSSGTGCSPLVGVSWEPRALPLGAPFRLPFILSSYQTIGQEKTQNFLLDKKIKILYTVYIDLRLIKKRCPDEIA